MKKIKAWVNAARLRTLPLSVAGILMSSAFVYATPQWNNLIFWLAILTTLALQILSNFANDYGDGVKGTDNNERTGPKRALQSGLLTDKELKKGIIINAAIAFLLALALIYQAFGSENFFYSILFLILGIIAIVAAINYTVGNSAYGYKGFGDLFVFLFFGLVSVIGSYFLYTKLINIKIVFPGIGIGLLSTAVLNLNNMRDLVGDKNSNKLTLVVQMGIKKAKVYHSLLILLGLFFSLLTIGIEAKKISDLLPFLFVIPFFTHLIKVHKNTVAKELDPELKKVALSTFGLCLSWMLLQIFS
ncbi:1,4-dihydroxy-2-naphthoate octaprenyltransferase [Psychroflexus maritimus]|uniref:1,4-dihydroxy-2-naphthoate octaprenyltransferase n=1 Tax=Psychroflexus maritimus TaxID=2714865 RepID=A0A967DY77_9FLAO|nr:1,4-dihydroxy-2-naphthoate octaprenyltransferase [Psychroflexus maritimus]NGZ89525.1 1,4-dihydroxy-2-naphthoate octaprenyltransferase [Psychroflexus maritimus]